MCVIIFPLRYYLMQSKYFLMLNLIDKDGGLIFVKLGNNGVESISIGFIKN